MSELEVLKSARKIIENADNWTQGVLARKADNSNCKVADAEACKFCMVGAVLKAADIGEPTLAEPNKYLFYDQLYRRLSQYLGVADADRMYLGKFNDESKHEDVLAAFDRAIAALEQEEKVNV